MIPTRPPTEVPTSPPTDQSSTDRSIGARTNRSRLRRLGIKHKGEAQRRLSAFGDLASAGSLLFSSCEQVTTRDSLRPLRVISIRRSSEVRLHPDRMAGAGLAARTPDNRPLEHPDHDPHACPDCGPYEPPDRSPTVLSVLGRTVRGCVVWASSTRERPSGDCQHLEISLPRGPSCFHLASR